MSYAVTNDGTDDAQIINVSCNAWKQLADRYAALAVVLEFPWRLHQIADSAFSKREGPLEWKGFIVILDQPYFRIKRIDARGTTMHEQKNNPFCASWKVRRLG